MELRKIRNRETIVQTSEEHSEKEIYHCKESNVTIDDPRIYRGKKAQPDGDDMKSVSVSSEAQKTGPENTTRSTKTKVMNTQ